MTTNNIYRCILDIFYANNVFHILQLKCPECPKFLATQQSLRMHIFTHTPEIEWPYECEFCQKRFKMRSDLPKHFNSILHRHDPEIPERDTDEYYAILDRSFTKPDPTQYLFTIIEEEHNVIECQGCANIFVTGPGYDEHLQVNIGLHTV